jgi:murein DD-endopeptidase MepM/ murein hydrolase activator NlpD
LNEISDICNALALSVFWKSWYNFPSLTVKKTIFYALAIVLVLLSRASFGEDVSNEQKKLQNIQYELADQKQKLKQTRVEEQKALSSLSVIKRNLKRAKKSLNEANDKVNYNQSKIAELKIDLAAAQSQIQEENRDLRLRIKEVYKSGSGSFLDLLFASRSMSDFINRTYYFGRLLGRDIELIGKIRQQLASIKDSRVQLESANREIKDSLRSIVAEKQDIARESAEESRNYQFLKGRRQEYERRVRELEASSLEIEKFVRSRGKTSAVSTGKFAWPMIGRITSPFGYRRNPLWGGLSLHTGIDIAGPYGKPISCADSGEVIYSGWWDGYGKAVVIDHGRGYTTVYGHMSRIYAQVGQKVTKGESIGLVGSTGFSTGPHLHFEIRVNGRPVDPRPYLL